MHAPHIEHAHWVSRRSQSPGTHDGIPQETHAETREALNPATRGSSYVCPVIGNNRMRIRDCSMTDGFLSWRTARRSPHPPLSASRNRAHGPRRVPLDAILPRPAATTHCPPETSRSRHQRESTLSNGLGGVLKGLPNILTFQVREGFENLGIGHPVGYHTDNSCHRDPPPTDAWGTPYLTRIHSNTRKRHPPHLLISIHVTTVITLPVLSIAKSTRNSGDITPLSLMTRRALLLVSTCLPSVASQSL
jgi:hypothetical protein